jgi:hypothetical protein
MTNDELDLTPDNEDAPESSLPDDEIRYAPPPQSQNTVPEIDATDDENDADDIGEYVPEEVISLDMPVTDGMDIEAALAAVSSLSDMLAEQEAAEQARIAQIEAEAQAAAERQARMEHPEQFFPVPPMSTLQRGQMASVIPALFLILVGAWLTFTLTTTKTAPNISFTVAIVLGGIGLALLVRWFNSGRWARGALFGGLLSLSSAAVLFYLLQPFSPGLGRGWPLLLCCIGIATALTGLLAFPADRRQIFPGIVLFIAGISGAVVSTGALGSEFINLAASLWPVAAVIVALILLLPLIFRQRG